MFALAASRHCQGYGTTRGGVPLVSITIGSTPIARRRGARAATFGATTEPPSIWVDQLADAKNTGRRQHVQRINYMTYAKNRTRRGTIMYHEATRSGTRQHTGRKEHTP